METAKSHGSSSICRTVRFRLAAVRMVRAYPRYPIHMHERGRP